MVTPGAPKGMAQSANRVARSTRALEVGSVCPLPKEEFSRILAA